MKLNHNTKKKLKSGKYWLQKNGELILISEMTDAHLTNTVKMLWRDHEEKLEAAAMCAASFSGNSMASYYAEGYFDSVCMSVPHPLYDVLVAEHNKRKSVYCITERNTKIDGAKA